MILTDGNISDLMEWLIMYLNNGLYYYCCFGTAQTTVVVQTII